MGVCRGGSIPGVWHSKGEETANPESFETLGEGCVLGTWILARSRKRAGSYLVVVQR